MASAGRAVIESMQGATLRHATLIRAMMRHAGGITATTLATTHA
jgi:hypothetical protein